jgi:putative colanic acid biosynthesis glycosyltransferase
MGGLPMDANNVPYFSIITITLNDLSGLRSTRASIEEQSLHDFEWIVIDGASTDGTVDELRDCHLPNFSYISEKDRGLYDAMNKGLERVRGQYVIFMNSADCFAGPSVLEVVRQRIEATQERLAIVFGDGIERTADSGLVLKPARPIHWLNYGMHTHHQAMFYSRDSLSGLTYDESFKVSADYDLTCRIYRRHAASLAVDIPICIFLRGGQSNKRAGLGRSDNWRVQRDVLRHSLGRRILTRMAYLVSYVIRKELRPVYDWLRFQRVHPQG